MGESPAINILVAESLKRDQPVVREAVKINGFDTQIYTAKNLKEAIKVILEKPIDLIVFESCLEDGDAVEFLNAIGYLSPHIIPTVVLAETKDEKMAIAAFRKGARDFIAKDQQSLARLPEILERIYKEETRFHQSTRLRKNNEAVLGSVSDGIIGLNLKGGITFANPAAALYMHQSFENMMGKNIEVYSQKIDRNFFQNLTKSMAQVRASNQPAVIGQYMLSVMSQPNQECVIEATLTPVFNEMLHLDGYVLSFRDITETKYLNEEIRHMAIQDDLTGLFNRKAFSHRLEHAISYCNRYQTKCAVMFVDLDGFKPINDALGHASGDELILQAANRIQAVVRDSDILARVGGDEFMVLLTHVNHPNDAARVAIKINRSLQPPFEINGNKYHITASIGIAIYPNDSNDAQKLIQYADCAMSMVKKRGKNDYQYYKSDLNAEAEKMMRISNDLRLAIENDQLELYFHPQICAKSGVLVGLEALIRWNHPELGMVPPTLFIPIAEEMGFISNIGQWVLGKACESYLKWKELRLENFTLSVNLSIKELQSEYFIDRIAQCMDNYPIDPKRIQFEITESIFANDAQAIIDKLHQLKSMGFQIAMDDFGTGYSCLSYLKDLPIDVIKIDRSFVQCLSFQDSQRHRSIIAAIIDLAKRLDMMTLAEGVETEEQADYLRSIGCEHFQGFLFAKPMPFEKTTEYIQKMMPNDDYYFGSK